MAICGCTPHPGEFREIRPRGTDLDTTRSSQFGFLIELWEGWPSLYSAGPHGGQSPRVAAREMETSFAHKEAEPRTVLERIGGLH
jgi:hypothetical protein